MTAAIRILFAIVCTLLLGHAGAQSLPVKKLGIDQGLSNNSIRCIYQDRNGFMWFGTYDGLNRYDGYTFKTFRNKINDTNSLPHNYINAIGEDPHNNIYIGTGQGLSIYNNLTANFSTGQYIPLGNKKEKRLPFNVTCIKSDTAGNLYVGTSGGGLLVKMCTSNFFLQIPPFKDKNGLFKADIQDIAVDAKQRVWVSIADAGLFLYHATLRQLQQVSNQSLFVRCIAPDNADNLWIGAYDGLYRYNTAAGTLTHAYEQQVGALSSNSVFSLAFDGSKQLWIGTEGGGIDVLDVATGSFTYLLPGDGKNNLSSETVYAIYKDKEQRKWIGTHKGGINIIDPQKSVFQSISHDPLNPNSLSGNFISSFYHDSSGNLWIGSDGGGISIWNRQTNHFTNYLHNPTNPKSLSNNAVPDMVEDYLGNVWIATYGNGINKFNKASRSFTHYTCINSQTGAENNYVWRLYQDREHNLWATTYANGRLYKLNRETDRFEMFSPEFIDLFCLVEDSEGTLWGGTAYGLCKVNKQAKTFQHYAISKPVRSIYDDKKGQFWIGTEGLGLILFDKKKGQVLKNYNDAHGLCNNSVLNILEDDAENLWLSTFHGLSKFNTNTKSFTNFYQEDGLQSNQFEYNAGLRLPSGEMAFGGVGGFTIFNPNGLQVQHTNPSVFLTGLRVNNEVATGGSTYITQVSGPNIRQITIPYNQAVLSFDFTALEYSLPDKIAYAYYLEGWDKGWNYTSLRTANYTRLKEGKYQLHIKATNAAGIWNPAEITLQVIVLPPWYRSWWAYSCYLLMLAVIIYFYNRYRVQKARLQYSLTIANLNAEREREKTAKEKAEREREHAELENERLEREKEAAGFQIERAEHEKERILNEKEKEINEQKMEFFTNIAHEFRTPLTLITNPVKELLQQPEQGKNTDDLKTVYHNARRMTNLVDQLLLFQKGGKSMNQLRPEQLHFCEYVQDISTSFFQLAKLKQIDYQIACDNKKIEVWADKIKLEIILYNLLTNAFKYTPSGGKVSCTVQETDTAVKVLIADTGYGIPANAADKIFERFYQVERPAATSQLGFGIGLYMVKQLAEAHHGNISYTSKIETGTTFILSLKKGNEHFDPASIIVNTPLPEQNAERLQDTEIAIPNTVYKVAVDSTEESSNEPLFNAANSILIIDDDVQMLQYISGIFKDDYTIHNAVSGEAGLKIAQQYLPDIIISDIRMGGMNGIEVCKTIKRDPTSGHIPVILLTGTSSAETKLESIEGGADDYIIKPFDKEILVARVESLLKNRNALQHYFYNEITLQQNNLKISAEYKEFIERCIQIVEENLEDEDFGVQLLAKKLAISRSNLFRKVKSVSGLSIISFIRFIRLRKAAELFINSDMNVNETAMQVGLTDLKYFRKQFQKLFGLNPSEYIAKYRKPFKDKFTVNRGQFDRN